MMQQKKNQNTDLKCASSYLKYIILICEEPKKNYVGQGEGYYWCKKIQSRHKFRLCSDYMHVQKAHNQARRAFVQGDKKHYAASNQLICIWAEYMLISVSISGPHRHDTLQSYDCRQQLAG